MFVPVSKAPGRGGVGDTARGLPHRGIFKGDKVPLKWSFASFSSIRKGWAGRGLGARPEPPPTPGPARFDRSYSSEAFGFKYSRSARAGRKAKLRCASHRDTVPAAMVFPRRSRRAARITSRLSLVSDRRERSAFCSPQVRQGLALALSCLYSPGVRL